jgi:alpha-1,6-mannosyltransferase
MSSPALTLCDLSPFYCDAGGGIRTYHRARLAWFANQERHQYVLVAPGPGYRVERLAPAVTAVTVYGPRLTRAADGYRLLIDFTAVRDVLHRFAPDVLETGDPWISGPLGLHLRRLGVVRGLLSSFYHSDPVATYVHPWLGGPPRGGGVRARALRLIERGLFEAQRRFDVTLAASREMSIKLSAGGVSNVVPAAMGADPAFFAIRRPSRPGASVALLYAARLDSDKEVELLIAILDRLLRRRDVTLTVAGRGRYQHACAAITHPRFSYCGYIATREALADTYARSDILLAPGRYETFGLSALEAAAAGLIVVGPDQGGTGEILADMGSPFRFKAGSADDFLDRTLDAIDSNRPYWSARSRALAWSYGSWPHAVAKQVALYGGLVEGRR